MKSFIAAICFSLVMLPAFLTAQSMDADDWDIRFSPGMPPTPRAVTTGGWEFDFPITSTRPRKRTVNYVVTSYESLPVGGSALMSLSIVATSGVPRFPQGNASVRFYIRRFGVGFNNEFSRWWSNPVSYPLTIGEATLVASFIPSQWSSVYGKPGDLNDATRAAFAKSLQHNIQIGMTFGGDGSFGHGVSVSEGTAKFIVTNFEVQP